MGIPKILNKGGGASDRELGVANGQTFIAIRFAMARSIGVAKLGDEAAGEQQQGRQAAEVFQR